MYRRAAILLSFLLLMSLTACSTAHEFEGGKPINIEDLESMSAALFQTEALSPTETDIPGTVYWTESGQVYHRDRNCPYLAKASSVKSGPVSNAVQLYGKDHPCSACGEE